MKKVFILFFVILVIIFSLTTNKVYASTEDQFITYHFGDKTISKNNFFTKYTENKENMEYHTSAYIPKESQESSTTINARNIVGTDNRLKVSNSLAHPFSFTGQIICEWDNTGDGIADYVSLGTGFIMGPDVIATAAHVVYDTKLGWPLNFKYYPAKNGDFIPLPFAEANEISISSAFTQKGDSDHDWAVIVLNRNVGQSTGWFGKGIATNIKNIPANVTGYPGDKPFGEMWTGSGKIISDSTYEIRHDIDTEAGQSGAPIYDNNGTVWGIHTRWSWLFGTRNYGRKFDEYLYNILQDKYLAGMEKYYS